MASDFEKLQKTVEELTKRVDELTRKVDLTADTSYKTGDTEIINRKVKFLQQVLDKNGNVVTEINP